MSKPKLQISDLTSLSYVVTDCLPREEDGMTSEKAKYWASHPEELKKALVKALSEVPSLS